jgi:mRNA-degrading endonuclease toxin of MazEF toxin-antitoxin module
MAFQTPAVVKTGDIFWCQPDPNDTVGSEQEKDRPWVVVSQTVLHRGNSVVAVPLSTNMDKACAHLIAIPKGELKLDGGIPANDSVALTDQIRALDKTRFRRKAGHISPRGLAAIQVGLERLFGL